MNEAKFQSETINEKIRQWELRNVEDLTLKYLKWVDEDGYADDIVDHLSNTGYGQTVEWIFRTWVDDSAIAERLVEFFAA